MIRDHWLQTRVTKQEREQAKELAQKLGKELGRDVKVANLVRASLRFMEKNGQIARAILEK